MPREACGLPRCEALRRPFWSTTRSDISAELSSGALALLEILEERSACLLEVLTQDLQHPRPARLQFGGRLTIHAHAALAQLICAQGCRRAFHGMHQVLQRVVLLGCDRGLHLPQ